MTLSDVTGVATAPEATTLRSARPRRYVMTAPRFFTVEYVINPWMDTSTPVDTRRALHQWEALRHTYENLGHTVELVGPVAGLPDMVYAANGGLIVNGKAVVARFAHAERAGESIAHAEWMTRNGYLPIDTRHVNEGQGDLLVVGSSILAGYGFRTDRRAHGEISEHVGMPVVSLELIDPRFYHLDTALAVLDDQTIAYFPPAFADHSRGTLAGLFPGAIEAASADA